MSKVVIKRRTSNDTWEAIFPQTTIDQIQGITTIAQNLLTFSEDINKNSVFVVNSSNQISAMNLDAFATAINAAQIGHHHTPDEITDLQTEVLDNYADLKGGVIDPEYLPSWVIGGLKLMGTISDSSIELNEGFRKTKFEMEDVSTDPIFHSGKYFIIEPESGLLSVTIKVRDDNVIYGEEGEGIKEAGSNVVLEPGDWLVFRGKNEENKYVFDVINNTYQRASHSYFGTVQLSNATTRQGLGSSSTKVIGEAVLKRILKSIHYTDDIETLNEEDIRPGDIVFEVIED